MSERCANYVAAVSFGLGDLVLSLPAVHALIDSGIPTTLVTRDRLQHQLGLCIDGLTGLVEESTFAVKDNERYYNLRDHPLQRDYWWGSESFERDYPGFKINDILDRICRDFGIAADFDTPRQLDYEVVSEVRGTVLFVPGSDGAYKCWPKECWFQLERLLRRRRVKVFMLGQPERCEAVRELLSEIDLLPTETIREALNVVSSCALVVGVDTGLTHLAVQQMRPTISLYRKNPVFVRQYDHCLALEARACADECQARSVGTYNSLTDMSGFEHKPWQCPVEPLQRCMSTIEVRTVLDAVLQKLEEKVSD